jgi:asparagine synthase (glutamine-hydrolysing)
MSGILGVWQSQKQTPRLTPWQKMLEDLTVLGKDGQGDWHDTELGLSLGRTQLFNTPESCQETPVIESEGCVLVWDGRVDERESLLAGRTNVTDAQLIIESYRRWGIDCLKHLIGEFVFILWDKSQDLLFVGCDTLGGRALAYYWDERTLLLSSRVLTLLHHPLVSNQLNHNYVAHTICGSLAHPPGITAFQEIKRLLPGSALVLKNGYLRSFRVHQLSQPDSYLSPKSPEVVYEKFWYLLDLATKDRLRSYRPVYSTLSGGLDSTTVTISLLNRLPWVTAFSYVTDKYPDLDESEAINAFLARYPQVDWRGINCDAAWALTEPWDDLPVVDDPLITCALPMNLKTMQLAQQQGFGIEFSGAWGDEFCYSLWGDQIRGRNWQFLGEHLKSQKRRPSFVWNQLLLPTFPPHWQTLWQRKRFQPSPDNLPEWLQETYVNSPEIKILLEQRFYSSKVNNRVQAIEKYLTETGCVGMTQLYRLLASFCGIESVAPFGDRRLIEFSHSIHPSLQVGTEYQKIFLRRANQTTLPDKVRLKPKNNCFDPLKYAGLGQGEQILAIIEQAKQHSYLQSIVDFEQLEQIIREYRRKYREEYTPNHYFYDDLGNKLLASVCFFDWFLRVDKFYF